MMVKNYSMFFAMSVMLSMSCFAMNQDNNLDDEIIQSSEKQLQLLLRSSIAGAGAGFVEVGFVGHLCSYFVNQSIRNKRFSLFPRQWKNPEYISLAPRSMYSGICMNLASMGPITAIQNALTEEFSSLFKLIMKKELSAGQQLVPPVIAGACAAISVATPTERIPNYMQKVITENGRKLTSWQATQELRSKYGIRTLWRGVSATAFRDGFFTVGYKTLPQMLQSCFSSKLGDGSGVIMSSSIIAGVLTALATQPFQVVARKMQNNENLKNSYCAVLDIYKAEGMAGLWKGGTPRGIRVMVAIPILSYVEKKLSATMSS